MMSKLYNQAHKNSTRRIINVRPLSLAALGMICGILAAAVLKNGFIAVIAVSIAILATVSLYFKIRVVSCISIGIMAGIICMSIARPVNGVDGTYTVSGRLDNIEKKYVYISDVKLNGQSFHKDVMVYKTTLPDDCSPAIGDTVEFTADIEFINIDLGDTYGLYLLSLNTGAKAQSVDNFQNTGTSPKFFDIFKNTRIAIGERIDTLFKRNAPMVRGILLGDTSYMDDDTLEAVRASGIAHILALSGLHVSIIVMFLNLVLRRMGYRVRTAIIAVFLLLYVAVAGFPPSLLRACVMTICMFLSTSVRRRYDSLSALALAAVIILIFDPYQIFTAGFLMSFGAMMGIILLASKIKSALTGALPNDLATSVSLSISATTGVLPPMLVFFKSVAIYGPLVNIIAVPIASVAVLAAFSGTVLSFVWDVLSVPFVYAADFMLDVLLTISKIISNLPFAVISTHTAPIILCLSLYALMFSLSDYLMVTKRQRTVTACTLAVICIAACF